MNRLPVSSLLAAALASWWLTSAAWAQSTVHPARTIQVRAELAPPAGQPDVPQAPRGAMPRLVKHGMPTLAQVDHGLPQPRSQPFRLGGVGPAAPCDALLRGSSVTSLSTTGAAAEPTVILAGRSNAAATVGFATGNWYAGLSTDSGASWTLVNPVTRFPAVDAGFCCDQVCIYEPSRDMTIWSLQYGYSPTTQRGSMRVAFALGSQLANNVWASYVFTPQSFGRPLGEWFDYPDLAVSNSYVYMTSNLFDAAGAYQDSLMWAMSIDDFAAGSGTVFFWLTSAIRSTFSVRFTRGAGDTIYGGSHEDSATIRIFKWTGPALTSFSRTHPSWVASGYQSLAPNGVNWAGRLDSRMTGAYQTNTEYGFAWTAAQTVNRPQPYARIARFRVSDDSHIADEDIWSTQQAALYPTVAANDVGHKAVSVSIGGPTLNPGTYCALVDDCAPTWAGQLFGVIAASSGPPLEAAWGDYASVQRHPVRSLGFVLSAQGRNAASVPFTTFSWLTRERDDPTHVAVTMRSTPITGVDIACTPDTRGRLVVTTDGYANYLPFANYTLTAPLTLERDGVVYRFREWRGRSAPSGSLVRIGTTPTLSANVGLQDNLMQAEYDAARRLDVGSRNPTTGVPIVLSVADVQGNQSGVSAFSRHFLPGTPVTLVAPSAHNAVNPFKRWWLDGVPQALDQALLPLTIAAGSAPIVAEAEFYTYVPGTLASFGSGCPGTGALTPSLTATRPDRGTTVTFTLTSSAASAPAGLYLGVSATAWNGTPLPLPLGFLGMGATCFLFVSLDATLPFATDANGIGTLPLPLPATLDIGDILYWQGYVLDLGAPSPLPLVHTNAVRTMIGGNR